MTTNIQDEQSAPLEWSALWKAMDASPQEWIPTTEAMYWEMLECVPPRAQSRIGFLVGEPLRSDEDGNAVHACFRGVNGQYSARNLTVNEFRSTP
jgi:hypothetical protein